MATTTLSLIGKQTVGADGASSVTFSNIPQTYTDLVVKFSTRATAGNPELSIRFNGDTAANYTFKVLYTSNGTSSRSRVSSSFGGRHFPISGTRYESLARDHHDDSQVHDPCGRRNTV